MRDAVRTRRGLLLAAGLLGAGMMLGLAACADPGSSDPGPTGPRSATPTHDKPPTKGPSVRPATTPTHERPSMDPRVAAARLLAAAKTDDVAAARTALLAGADVETRDATALLVATRHNAVGVARLLLAEGADPDAKDSIQDSAFLYAGAEGLDEILAACLAHGANVRSLNRYGGTALIPASEHGHVSTVRMLLEAGTPVDHVNKLSWTALHEAIVLGTGSAKHVETVRLLIAAGADVRIPDGNGTSPRRLAAERGYDEIVALIDAAL